MNVSKAGQAIPLKWRLTDANGAPVSDLTAVAIKAKDLSCASGVTTDLIEEYAAGARRGSTTMGDGNYQFNWKTPTTLRGHLQEHRAGVRTGGSTWRGRSRSSTSRSSPSHPVARGPGAAGPSGFPLPDHRLRPLVTIPATPRAHRRRAVAGSSTVQTCTGQPSARAAATKRRVGHR